MKVDYVMPPHCDTLDGPVVKAAAKALKEERVEIILPYVPKAGEEEVRVAFKKVVQARQGGDAAINVGGIYARSNLETGILIPYKDAASTAVNTAKYLFLINLSPIFI